MIFSLPLNPMATVRSNSITVFFVVFILFATAPSPSQSISFSSYFRYRDLFSLSHSLLIGVANLRASRGDVVGADRARAMANSLDRGTIFGFVKLLWTWSWTDLSFTDLYGVVSDMNELLRGLTELTRLESVAERSAWISRNYQSVLTVSKSLSSKLLKAFRQSVRKTPVFLYLHFLIILKVLLRQKLSYLSNTYRTFVIIETFQ